MIGKCGLAILQDQRHQDPSKLTESIVDFGIGNGRDWDEVVISEELQTTTRAKARMISTVYGTDPRLYDSRKHEQDLEAVDAVLEHGPYAEPEPEMEGVK